MKTLFLNEYIYDLLAGGDDKRDMNTEDCKIYSVNNKLFISSMKNELFFEREVVRVSKKEDFEKEIYFLNEGRRMSIFISRYASYFEEIGSEVGMDLAEIVGINIDFYGQTKKKEPLNTEDMNFKNPVKAFRKIMNVISRNIDRGEVYKAWGNTEKRASIYKRFLEKEGLKVKRYGDDCFFSL